MKISVVIPVYNEEDNILELYTRLSDSLAQFSYELIFVDDGSKDKSFTILKSICKKDHKVRIVKLIRNFGQHIAISAGLKHIDGNIAITMDADLQNPPEEIPKLIEKLNEGYDLAWGVFEERRHSFFRKVGSYFAKYLLCKIMGNVPVNISTFRAISADLVKRINTLTEKNRFLDGMMIWLGARAATVPVKHNFRYKGKTKYDLFRLIHLWFDMVTSFSEFPLKLATYAGILFGMAGFILACFYLIKKLLFAITVTGFTTIVILILIFSGIQLFCLGMVGEYVARIFMESKNRPLFIIEDSYGFQEQTGKEKDG